MVKLAYILGAVTVFSTSGTAADVSPTSSVAASTTPSAADSLSSLGLSLPAGNVLVGNVGYTCNLLRRTFPQNETFTASSPYYEPLIDEAWSGNCRLNASCIVTPKSAQEVSLVIQILSVLDTKFSIRSGGHSSSPGFSSIGNNGVLVALERLNTLSISADRKTLTVGPGNRWEAVYQYLEQYNLTVLGGREPVVGVGGFVLGGGLSLFYNTNGLAIDTVTRFQVVTPNGTIVNATPTEHADLYKGLKGGLNNFGIIVEYDLTTNTGIDVWFEVKNYTRAETPALLAAYATYLQNADVRSNVEIQANPAYTVVLYGYLDHVSAPSAFNAFSTVPSVSTVYPPTNASLNEVLLEIGTAGVTGSSWTYTVSFSFKVTNPDFLQESYKTYLEAAASLLPSGVLLEYVPQGIIPNLVTKGQAQNGGNLLGLEATPQVWGEIFAQFPATVSQSTVASAVNDLLAKITSSAESQGVHLPYIFANDAGPDQQVLRGYGEDNLKYIATIAERYDPKGVMQKLQNDAYFVSKEL
ncbi:CAZyme family AA7 [Aspergillus niger]|nr:CAZyme family AA7 [Aspergillus niger]KAI2887862.1 CAZyme family AA7 [Aspergillus niger]KAI2913315.1 CAZyme family AA7 [Aspergillus niger]